MKKFSKLLAVVLAIAIVICPMMSAVAFAEGENSVALTVDGNEAVLTINNAAGFLVTEVELAFTADGLDTTAAGYTDGLKIVDYTLVDGTKDEYNLPTASLNIVNDVAKVIVCSTDAACLDLYSQVKIGIALKEEATVTVDKITAADKSETPAYVEFDNIGADGVPTETIEATAEEAAEVYNADLKFSSTSAIFQSDYSLVYYIKDTRYDTWSNFSIVIEKEQFDGNTQIASSEIVLTSADKLPDKYGSYYQFKLSGISAKEVASGLTATIHATVGGVASYGVPKSFNLVDYATTYVNDGDEFAGAMVAFLNYASAAQTYFGYNTGNLANAALTPAQKAYTDPSLTDNLATTNKIATQTAKTAGATVVFKSQILMKIYVNPLALSANDLYLNFAWTDASSNVHNDTYSLADATVEKFGGNDCLVFEYDQIPAKDMRSLVYFKVVDVNGVALSHTRSYSLESYAYTMATDAEMGPLTNAMIVFGDKLAAYFASR